MSALSYSLKGMLFSRFNAIKVKLLFICHICLLLFTSNGSVSKNEDVAETKMLNN